MVRGGLIHVNDNLFFLFVAMEAEMKSHFSVANPSLIEALSSFVRYQLLHAFLHLLFNTQN